MQNFQNFILSLTQYWLKYDCLFTQAYDLQMGAGTFHPHTFLKGLGPEPWRSVYVQACRRPLDGRYGKSAYRFQHYYQMQVLLKPAPANIIDIFLQSLVHIGINLADHDIGLLEDNWKGPTLGAWGLGWELRANGQEITQFTYFQQLGGMDVDSVCSEITYGLERLYMYASGIKNAFDIPYNDHYSLGDIYRQNEYEFSCFNFKEASISQLSYDFDKLEEQVAQLCLKNLVLPAYDYVLQMSHLFNLLDARGAISTSKRQQYIAKVRNSAKKCAVLYKQNREKLAYPLLHKLANDPRIELCATDAIKSFTNNKIINLDLYTENTGLTQKEFVDIVFEVGVEEMPPDFQQAAYAQLQEKILLFIAQRKNKFAAEAYFLEKFSRLSFSINISARRIGVQFNSVILTEPAQKIEIFGPAQRIAMNAQGELTQAGLGFCKKNQINPADVSLLTKDDGTFLYFRKNVPGANIPLLLAQEFKNWLYALAAPLKMRWLPTELSPSFIRPVRSILAMVEDKIIPLEMFGLNSANYINGQRILSPQKFYLQHANNYRCILQQLQIEADPILRKQNILAQAMACAQEIGGILVLDEELLTKCVGLYESPYVFIGRFDATYLKLPHILLCNVLKEHMHYFSVQDERGFLLDYYIGIANYRCNKVTEMIEATKSVVSGRFDDGAFYFSSDLATPLSELKEKLKNQSFQENLGTMDDKTKRLVYLSTLLQKDKILQTAAEFCKADLQSGCVQEFPDTMQGVMGGILVRSQKILALPEELEQLALAIEQHYLPLNASSPLPSNSYALILSLVDKLDSLCMMINNIADIDINSNKDPLGMRRMALAIVRILGLKAEINALNLSLHSCVQYSLNTMTYFKINIAQATYTKVMLFLLDRIKFYLKDLYNPTLIEACNTKLINLPLPDAIAFIDALQAYKNTKAESFNGILSSYRRIYSLTKNIIDIQEIDTKLFIAEELSLFEAANALRLTLQDLMLTKSYIEIYDILAEFAQLLDEFFSKVLVNDQNLVLRANRLALLCHIRSIYHIAVDFSKI